MWKSPVTGREYDFNEVKLNHEVFTISEDNIHPGILLIGDGYANLPEWELISDCDKSLMKPGNRYHYWSGLVDHVSRQRIRIVFVELEEVK